MAIIINDCELTFKCHDMTYKLLFGFFTYFELLLNLLLYSYKVKPTILSESSSRKMSSKNKVILHC